MNIQERHPALTSAATGQRGVPDTTQPVGDSRLRRVAAVLLLLVPPTTVVWAFRPGYMNVDSLILYGSTQGGPLTDWYAPVIQLLWAAAERLGIGHPTVILFGQCLAMVVGCYLILRVAMERIGAALATVVLFALPTVFAHVMLVGRDMWLLGFALLQVGCLVRWVATPTAGARRTAWLTGAVCLGVLSILTRQNAAALAFFPFVAMFVEILRRRRPGTNARRRLFGSVGLSVAVCIATLAMAVVVQRVAGVTDARPEVPLYAFDLAGMSLEEGEILLAEDVFPSQDLDRLRARWDPDDVVNILLPMTDRPVRAFGASAPVIDHLERSWRDAVLDHPAAYLRVRTNLFLRLIGVTAPPRLVMHVGIDQNRYGFTLASPSANETMRDYVAAFAPSPNFAEGSDLFRPWPYLLIGLFAAVVLLRRRAGSPSSSSTAGRVVASMVLGALAYESTFFFLAPGQGYRYSHPVIVMCLVAAVFAVAQRTRRGDVLSLEEDVERSVPPPLAPDVVLR